VINLYSLSKVRQRSAQAALTGLFMAAMLVLAALLSVAVATRPAQAQAQPVSPLPTPVTQTDASCRGCHGDKTDVLTLPSGETLPLGVDLAALDASPHAAGHDGSLSCTSCHVNETQYRYPHLENSAQSAHEYAVAVSQNCESCHYPHLPFHETVDAIAHTPPTCADCHGNHDIVRVDEMWHVMPDKCVACHTDRSRDWVAEFLTPLPGVGAGAEGYGGSLRCAGCHEENFFTWRDTLHAQIVQDVDANPEAVIGDFQFDYPERPFTLEDVSHTIGSRWKQVYMTRTVSDTFQILPAQWDVRAEAWAPYHSEDGETMDWTVGCSGCHVTGLDIETGTFKEFGVGCESCHGPGAAHAADPENAKPYVTVDAQVCGACHSRGVASDGVHPFPVTYNPGDTLADHFTFTDDPASVWPDGSARQNHQQYMDWQLGSSMALAPDMSCATCHAVHGGGVAPGQLKETTNELCLSCHGDQRAIVRHTPFHEVALTQRDFLCTDCHMPLMATSSDHFDIHNHSLLQPNPQGSLDHGGLAAMPNACNNCHSRTGEDAAWANQTIAFARQQAPPVAGGFFGPGPTPTSPPPPTPMASVGQPPLYDLNVDTGFWVRRALIAVIVVVLFLVIAWAFYWIQRRRTLHV
jgi:predicted CXXCH cytochrome family protein